MLGTILSRKVLFSHSIKKHVLFEKNDILAIFPSTDAKKDCSEKMYKYVHFSKFLPTDARFNAD